MLCDRLQCAGSRLRVDAHAPAEECLRPNRTAHHVCIRKRGFDGATDIACRTGIRPSRAWTHTKHAAFVHPYDGSAAGTDRVDVEERNADWKPVELKLLRQLR